MSKTNETLGGGTARSGSPKRRHAPRRKAVKKFLTIPICKIDMPAHILRSDPSITEGFEASLQNNIVQPVVVRPKTEGRFELVAGYRRFSAFKKMGRPTIPCVVRLLNDQQAAIATLVENLDREEVPPMDTAKFISEYLISELGMTQDAVAKALGKDEGTVSNWLRVYNDPILREAVDKKTHTVSSALEVLAAEPKDNMTDEERAAWKKSFVNKTAKMSESRIRKMKQGKPDKQPRMTKCIHCGTTRPVTSMNPVCDGCLQLIPADSKS